MKPVLIRFFILIVLIVTFKTLSAQVKDSAWYIPLDTITVKPYLSWNAFKDSFINMQPEKRVDLFRYYPEPPGSDEAILKFIPVFEIQPGVHLLVLPYSHTGPGISATTAVSIDMLYTEGSKRSRKRKRSKVLPKFE